MDIVYFIMNVSYILLCLIIGVDTGWAILNLMVLLGFQITGTLVDILKELKKK